MRKVILLWVLLSLISAIHAQNKQLEYGFCIQSNPMKKEVYLIDINEKKCQKSPLDINNKAISLKAIKDDFRNERIEIVKIIFNEDDFNRLKNSSVIATIYINSKTKKIDAVSFRFRNMNKEEIERINIEKFAKYREMLINRITIQTLIFEDVIAKHGYISQTFRVL